MQPRAYKRTTVPGEAPVVLPDLIGRAFTGGAPGEPLVGDITYLRTGEGWLYLATVIDLATRRGLTTANGCIPPSATARPPKPSTTTGPQHDQQTRKCPGFLTHLKYCQQQISGS